MNVGATCFYILPALNEDASVAMVISALRAVDAAGQVVLVDDNSDDSTALVAEAAGARILSLCDRLGSWGAIQAGIRYAAQENTDYVVTIDADGQHLPEQIGALFHALERSGANVVIGACAERASRLRRLAWTLMRRFSGISAEDLTSGLRLYDRRAMDVLISQEASYLEHQDIGVLSLLLRNKLDIVEVTVHMRPRIYGSSRIFSSWIKVFHYMLQSLLLGVAKRQVKRFRPEKYVL